MVFQQHASLFLFLITFCTCIINVHMHFPFVVDNVDLFFKCPTGIKCLSVGLKCYLTVICSKAN